MIRLRLFLAAKMRRTEWAKAHLHGARGVAKPPAVVINPTSIRHWRLLPCIAVLIATSICGQQTSAQPLDTYEPPARERLLPPPREQPGSFDAKIVCRREGSSCAEPLSLDGTRLYSRLRRWWRPPDNTRISTTMWFGASARAAVLDGPQKDTVSLVLELDRSGGLHRPPQTMLPDRLGFARTVVADLLCAVERGQPYDMFSSAKYEQWKDVLLRIRIEPRSKDDVVGGKQPSPPEANPAK
jgi:hypothetical protein